MPVEIQWVDRLHRWAEAHPGSSVYIEPWIERFKRDPRAQDLYPFPVPVADYDAYQYDIPGISEISVVMGISRHYNDEGVLWTYVLYPRKPTDELPDHDRPVWD